MTSLGPHDFVSVCNFVISVLEQCPHLRTIFIGVDNDNDVDDDPPVETNDPPSDTESDRSTDSGTETPASPITPPRSFCDCLDPADAVATEPGEIGARVAADLWAFHCNVPPSYLLRLIMAFPKLQTLRYYDSKFEDGDSLENVDEKSVWMPYLRSLWVEGDHQSSLAKVILRANVSHLRRLSVHVDAVVFIDALKASSNAITHLDIWTADKRTYSYGSEECRCGADTAPWIKACPRVRNLNISDLMVHPVCFPLMLDALQSPLATLCGVGPRHQDPERDAHFIELFEAPSLHPALRQLQTLGANPRNRHLRRAVQGRRIHVISSEDPAWFGPKYCPPEVWN